MWNLARRQLCEQPGRISLLLSVAAALLLSALPIAAQEETPTATPAATSTLVLSTDVEGGVCIYFQHECITDECMISDDGTAVGTRIPLYILVPNSHFLAGYPDAHAAYTDSSCETEYIAPNNQTIRFWLATGGLSYASDADRDTAWEICETNNTKRLTSMRHHNGSYAPLYGSVFDCFVGTEDAPPGGQSRRFMSGGHFSKMQFTEERGALEVCRQSWSLEAKADDEVLVQETEYGWMCMLSWTVGAASTETPTGLPSITPVPPTDTPAPPTQTPVPTSAKPGRAHSLAAWQTGGIVVLEWSAPDDGGAVTGYRIWRRLPDMGETEVSTLVDNTGSDFTEYVDTRAVDGQKHIYRVQALSGDHVGQESLPVQIVVRPAPTGACVYLYTSDVRGEQQPTYVRFYNNNFLGFGDYTVYSDPNCTMTYDTENDFNFYGVAHEGGLAYASEHDTAWEICVTNNSKRIEYIRKFYPSTYWCEAGDEDAPPGGQTERRKVTSNGAQGTTAAEALADCRVQNSEANRAEYAPSSPTDTSPWRCLYVWTLGDTQTPTPTATATSAPTDTPTATETDTPTPAPKPGCVNVGPGAYWLFPASNFLSGTIAVHNSDQCASVGTTQNIGADGYVFTATGQSAAAALCQTGHGGGQYQAQQQAFNTSLYACQYVAPTATPITPTNTPLPPTDTPVPPTNTPAPQKQQQLNAPDQTRPGRAHNLSAAQSGSAASLSWSPPSDGGAASGYRIWRRLPDRGETDLQILVDNTGSAATNYLDASAVAGQKHVYRVQALNGIGAGQQSKPAQIVVKAAPADTPVPTDTPVPATNTPVPTDTPVPPTHTPVPTDTPIPPTDTPIPTDPPVPGPPGRAHNLAAAQSGDSVSLNWSAPADGGDVNGYRIWRRLPDKGEQNLTVLVDNTGSAATSYVDGSAENRQKHIYRVQALGPGGEGQMSKPAQIIVRR